MSSTSCFISLSLGPDRIRNDTPQALHLADTQRRVYVVVQTHLQRGDFVWRSAKANVAAAPTWDRNQHVCEFKVEALEASGTLRYANQVLRVSTLLISLVFELLCTLVCGFIVVFTLVSCGL